MKSTRSRFIGVALLVCLFAVGMATFLNYYKYKATFGNLVKSRLLVIGYGIENGVQSSLGLGLAFNELTTLNDVLQREGKADRLITGIDVFDSAGKVLYSTDPARLGKDAPESWRRAASAVATGANREYSVQEQAELVSGIALRNSFDLTVGYLAMRYDRAYVDANVAEMGLRLLGIGAAAFIAAGVLCALALSFLLRGYERDMRAISERLSGGGTAEAVPQAFSPAVEELRASVAEAEQGLGRVRAGMGAA